MDSESQATTKHASLLNKLRQRIASGVIDAAAGSALQSASEKVSRRTFLGTAAALAAASPNIRNNLAEPVVGSGSKVMEAVASPEVAVVKDLVKRKLNSFKPGAINATPSLRRSVVAGNIGRNLSLASLGFAGMGGLYSLANYFLPKKSEAPSIIAAGLCLLAADTGRVLMLQRSMTESDPAAGKWEFPGGHIESWETPLDAAKREFAEEVGCRPPADMHVLGHWRGGVYVGYVAVIKSEKDVKINKPAGRRYLNPDDPDGDNIETVAWWVRRDLRNNTSVRAELRASYDDFKWASRLALLKYNRGDFSKVAEMNTTGLNEFEAIEQGLRNAVISKVASIDLSSLTDSASKLWTDIRNSPRLHGLGLGGDALRNIGAGAALGGAAGLGANYLSGDGRPIRNALIGALLGGAGGYGTGAALHGINYDSRPSGMIGGDGLADLSTPAASNGVDSSTIRTVGTGIGGGILGAGIGANKAINANEAAQQAFRDRTAAARGKLQNKLSKGDNLLRQYRKFPPGDIPQYHMDKLQKGVDAFRARVAQGEAHAVAGGTPRMLARQRAAVRGAGLRGGLIGAAGAASGQYLLEKLMSYLAGSKQASIGAAFQAGKSLLAGKAPMLRDKLLAAIGTAKTVASNPVAQQMAAGGVGALAGAAAAPQSDSAKDVILNSALGIGGGALLGRDVGNYGKVKIKSVLDKLAAYLGKKAVSLGTVGGAVGGLATSAIPAMASYAGSSKEANALILIPARSLIASQAKGKAGNLLGRLSEIFASAVRNPTVQSATTGAGMAGWGMSNHADQGSLVQGLGLANSVVGGGIVGDAAAKALSGVSAGFKGKSQLARKLLSKLSSSMANGGAVLGAAAGSAGFAANQKPKTTKTAAIDTAELLAKAKSALTDPTYRPLVMGAGGALAGAAATTAGEAMSHKQNKDYLTAALTGGVAGGGIGAGFGYLTRNGISGLLPKSTSSSNAELGSLAEAAKNDPKLLAELKAKADQHPSVARQFIGKLHKEQNDALPLADELVAGGLGAYAGGKAGARAVNYLGTTYDANYIDLMRARQRGLISGVDFEDQLNKIQNRIKEHGPNTNPSAGRASESFLKDVPNRLKNQAMNVGPGGSKAGLSLTQRLLAALKLGKHQGGKLLAKPRVGGPLGALAGGILSSAVIPRLIPSGE